MKEGVRINKEIRAYQVRLLMEDGEQLGIFKLQDALMKAREMGLDLVEVAPLANPPVCKIIDYGRLRYQQTKREKLHKRSSHQIKIKEIKIKINIDKHDLETKLRHARSFLEDGNKVRFVCLFRGREIAFVDKGREIFQEITQNLEDLAIQEESPKILGRFLTMMLVPNTKRKKKIKKQEDSSEVAQSEDQ